MDKDEKPARAPRGFAAMDPARQRELASLGGKRAHESGRGHQWDSAAASAAGKRGGMASRGGRGKLPAPGGGPIEQK